METPIISTLASFAVNTTFEDIPEPIIRTTKKLLLDSIGCGLGGATTDPGKMAISLARTLGGPEECTILGAPGKVSVTNAALANGQLINALDFDTVMPGGHTPPYAVATVLAMAERAHASGRDLLAATAIACEIGARIAAAVPSAFQFVGPEKKLQYPTREGYSRLNFGSAAGAGRLMDLDHAQMVNALALAGHMSQLNTWTRSNFALPRNLSKYGFPGWQNTGAITSVFWAQMGLDGDVTLLDDAEHGYGEFAGYDAWEPSRITQDIGTAWSFDQVRFKPYACCTMLHRAVECFAALLEEHDLRPAEIENVTAWASPTVEADLFTDRTLNNIVDFQFGIHSVLAMVAFGEGTGADWQDWNKLSDPRIAEFAKKVDIKGDPEYSTTQASTVEIQARGQTFRKQLRGHTEPLEDHALVHKFRDNAARVLTQRQIDQAVGHFDRLEELEDVTELTAVLSI